MSNDTRPKRANAKVITSLASARVNKNKLRELAETAALKDAQIVNLLMAESKRPCGIRTLMKWLGADEQKKPHRCPDWAVQALENAQNAVDSPPPAGAQVHAELPNCFLSSL